MQPTRCEFFQFICFCKTLYMFQTAFSSIIRSSKLCIQRQMFVRPLLLPAASLNGIFEREHPVRTFVRFCKQGVVAACHVV